jgi:hypothetical protein
MKSRIAVALLAALATTTLAAEEKAPVLPTADKLQRGTARFVPTPVAADVSALPANERQALARLVEAARLMDPLFARQVWGGNEAALLDLAGRRDGAGRTRLHAWLVNKGPWSRLDENAPFLPGAPAQKPPQGSFYPLGATKEQVEAWWTALPADQQELAKGFFSVIRFDPKGELTAVPYSVAYQPELEIAARLLREAAALTTQPTLKAYLEKRAAAFLSNDYYESDVAWMELDASIEPTIGPYETYEDEWFGAKAAFEAFITVRDEAETKKLQRLSDNLQELEDHLPIEPAWRNPKLGALAPIRVVNVIFTSGDANRGVQTAAFNLPNDERVVQKMGSKRVMLKNVQHAKFDKVLRPITGVALAAADRPNVSFDAFFTHILMHELMHGLGPGVITVDGKSTTTRAALKDTFGAIEEAKADMSGLWALQYLVTKGALDKSLEKTMYTTFLASAFRSIRFGLNSAHGRGIAVQLNRLIDSKAVKVAADGTFSVVLDKMPEAVSAITRELMTLQATGDYAGARKLLDEQGVVRPEVKRILDRLGAVPVDIEPQFTTADALTGRGPAQAPEASRKASSRP